MPERRSGIARVKGFQGGIGIHFPGPMSVRENGRQNP